jgi:L-iditol 2-dehydrogenase
MRAARLYGRGDLRVEEVGEVKPAEGDAVVRVGACGVCPSDVRGYAGVTATAGPWTPGHEVAGTVVELPPGYAGELLPGSRVTIDWRQVCGTCAECVRGAANFCQRLVKLPVAGFAEFSVVPATALRPVPAGVDLVEAAFTEPLACVVNAHRAMPVPLGGDVVVVGAGPIGLLHAQLARARSARVIVADMNPSRLAVASRLGAQSTVDVSTVDTQEAVRELTGGRGADVVIVTVGTPAVIASSLRLAARNGTVNLFAGTHPKADLALDPDLLHYDQLTLTGSHDYTPGDFATATRLIRYRIVDVAALVSHRLPLRSIVDAFDITVAQSGLKTVIVND